MKSLLQNLKKNMLVALGILIAICATVLIIAFNTPGKRFNRAMEAGDKAYAKGSFETAVAQYTKAIKIKDDKIDAYLGLISAKEAEGAEDLKETFLQGLAAIEAMGENDRYIVLDRVIEYVLHDSVIFTDDLKERIEVLDRGYDLTYGDKDVRRELTECVSAYIESLRVSEEYDEALEYVERFTEKTDIKAERLTARLNKEKEFAAKKGDLLKSVYDALKPFVDAYSTSVGADPYKHDFKKILSIDGSDSAETVASAYVSGSCFSIFESEGNDLTGKGAGLYTFGDTYKNEKGSVATPYYFYTGDYKDGVRSGFGVSFMKVGEESFVLYAGEWENDLPSGKGTRYEKITDTEGDGSYTQTYAGNWLEGLAEGTVSITVTEDMWDGIIFSGEVNAKKGVCDEVPSETDEYVVLNLKDARLVGVLASDTEGYALMITIWQSEDETIGALGLN